MEAAALLCASVIFRRPNSSSLSLACEAASSASLAMPIRAYAYTNNHNVVTCSQLHFLKSVVILIKYLVIPWFEKKNRLIYKVKLRDYVCCVLGIIHFIYLESKFYHRSPRAVCILHVIYVVLQSININVAEQLCILVGIFYLGFYIEQASMEFYFHIVLPSSNQILPLFQIIRCFGFSRYIVFIPPSLSSNV